MIGHDFPYLDTKDLNLDWLLKNMKKLIGDWATYQTEMNQSFSDLNEAFSALKSWVENYFEELDVQQEINIKLDAMRASGELAEIMTPLIATDTAAWLAEHITNPSSPPIDTSLTISNAAADAKATGDRFAAMKEEINEVVVRQDNSYFQYGYWNDSGIYTLNYNRLCNKQPIPVYKGDSIVFYPDGLYVCFEVFADSPSAEGQPYLEKTEYQTGADSVSYTIMNDGYLVFNMQNAATYPDSTQPASTTAYDAVMVVYRDKVTSAIAARIDQVNQEAGLTASVIPTKPFEIKIEKVNGYYETDTGFLGGGTRIKCPHTITGILANFRSETAGTGYCEILDENMNVLATATSAVEVNTDVLFSFDNFVSGKDIVWVRMYGEEGVIPKRSEVSIVNANMISKQSDNAYHIYYNGSAWVKTASAAYCIPFTVIGSVAKRTLNVSKNGQYDTIKSATDYVRTLPIYEWDIIINDGVYDLYTELGGDDWYADITSADGNMQGISLGDYVNLIGDGDVTLQLIAPDSLASADNVPNVSVLELPSKHNIIKNIKCVGKNVRYVIHDETDNKQPNQTREYSNIELTHQGVVSGTWSAPGCFGCGFSSNSFFIFNQCVFNNSFIMHNNTDQEPSNIVFNNCQFLGKSYAISLNQAGTNQCYVYFNNCFIDYFLRLVENSDVFQIRGGGNNKSMCYAVIGTTIDQAYMQLSDDTVYMLAGEDITKFAPIGLRSGGVGGVKIATTAQECIGIAIESAESGNYVRVKTKGMVDCYGIAPFSGGTLFGVSSNGSLIADATNPIGITYNVDGINLIYLY